VNKKSCVGAMILLAAGTGVGLACDGLCWESVWIASKCAPYFPECTEYTNAWGETRYVKTAFKYEWSECQKGKPSEKCAATETGPQTCSLSWTYTDPNDCLNDENRCGWQEALNWNRVDWRSYDQCTDE